VDFHIGQLLKHKLIANHPSQATVFQGAVRRSWKIPYAWVEAAESTARDSAKPHEPAAEPARAAGSGLAMRDR
jgi:hypothetical protein